MELKILSIVEVQKASPDRFKRTDQYNTHHHTFEDINAQIPEGSGLFHTKPEEYPVYFDHWVPLIAGTRQWHIIELSPSLIHLLREVTMVWSTTGKISQRITEEVLDRFPHTTKGGISTDTVFGGDQRWFLRLDYCSAKDCEWVEPGGIRGCVTTKESMINILSSSIRSMDAIERYQLDPKASEKIYLMPWNDVMDPRREYRVFCPPLRNRISAISQYSWWQPYQAADSEEVRRRAKGVLEGALDLHVQILRHAEHLSDPSIARKLTALGFVFDVLETPDGKLQLVELNPFGAMSGCGTCLFQWINDAELLYGLRNDVEFRIAM